MEETENFPPKIRNKVRLDTHFHHFYSTEHWKL